MPAAATAREIAAAARQRAADLAAALDPADFTDHRFYRDLRDAYATAGVRVVDGNTVVAWVRDRRFQYVAASILDVSTVDAIFNAGHIEDDGARGARFLLRCDCGQH